MRTKHCFDKDVVCFFHVLLKLNGEITVFFCQKNNRQICDICLPRIQEHFLKKFFLKKFFFFIIGHWATFVCHFDEILSVQMSVLLSVCQLDQFVVKKFLSNIFFLHQLQTLIANWSVFVRIFSAKLTTLPFTSPRYQFDERKTFWQIFVCFIYHLRTLSKKIKAFFGKQSAALSKWLTTCPRRFFAKNFFFKKVLFLFQHWALSERFLSFRRKFVGPVVSTAFCLSLRPVCGEKILSNFFSPSVTDMYRKIIGLCWNFFRPNWRHCFLQVRRINLKSSFCFEKFLYVFYPSRTLNEKLTVFLSENK